MEVLFLTNNVEAWFVLFKALATHEMRHHRQMEMVSRSVITNECPVCLAVHGDRKAAHRHLLSPLRRGSCRDRSRFLGQVHIPLSLRCPVCLAEPGNWSELQQHLAKHLCDVFKNDGLRDAFLQAQAGGGSARAGPSSGETGGGRRVKRSRCHSAPGGRAGNSVSGQRGRTERTDSHSVQDVPGSMLRERGRSNGRGRSTLPRIRWRYQEQARSRARRRSRAARSPVRACVGGVPAQLWRRRGGWHQNTWRCLKSVLGEQRGEERTSAAGGTRTALSSEAVQENRGQGRLDAHRVLPGPRHSHRSTERWKQHCSCRKG